MKNFIVILAALHVSLFLLQGGFISTSASSVDDYPEDDYSGKYNNYNTIYIFFDFFLIFRNKTFYKRKRTIAMPAILNLCV